MVSVKEYNDEEAYLFDLDSSLSYTYVDGTNQIDTITSKTELDTNELDVTYGSISSGQMPDAVYSEWWNNIWCRSYSYDSLGRLSTVGTRAGTGSTWLESTYTYKTDGNKTTSQVSSLSTPDRDYTYTYDNRGNITAIYDGECYTIYEYDNLDQLIRENNQRENVTYVYSYSDGNIVSRTKYIYTLGDPSTEISTDTWTYGDSTWGDVLTAYNGVSTNATNGKVTSLNGKSLTYSYLGLLATAGTTSYTYDTSGRRLSKTTGNATTNYYYAGDMLVGQKTGNNKIEFLYDSNGDYYGFEYNDTAYYYIKNLQGDVTSIADSTGNIICRYFYDAWGRLLSSTDTSGINIGTINPIRYRSYYYDTETGFYYVSSRYYAPEIGRFISPDTTDVLTATLMGLTDKNLYAYCDNNPVVRVDYGGQFWDTIFDVVSLCVSVVDVIKDPSDAMAWVGLAADVVSLAVPFATGGGAIVKAATKADDVVDAVKTVDKIDDVIDTTKTAKKTVKVHGNSLKSTKTNYGYALVDRNNNIMKFGETVNPKTRYSQKYLNQNGYSMKILESGSKADIHYWQYDMNMYYRSRYGSFPPLNKRGW